jgi:hypothetical protein
MDDTKAKIESALGGELLRRFNELLQEVAHNVMDPNTDAKAKRSVNMCVTIKPNNAREMAEATFEVWATLADPKPESATYVIVLSRDGAALHDVRAKQPALFSGGADKPPPPHLAERRARREEEQDDEEREQGGGE